MGHSGPLGGQIAPPHPWHPLPTYQPASRATSPVQAPGCGAVRGVDREYSCAWSARQGSGGLAAPRSLGAASQRPLDPMSQARRLRGRFAQPLPAAGVRNKRTLEAVSGSAFFGADSHRDMAFAPQTHGVDASPRLWFAQRAALLCRACRRCSPFSSAAAAKGGSPSGSGRLGRVWP